MMIERRKGGETGVKAVTCLTGKDVWKAGDAGKWSWDLLEAALSRSETVNPGDIRKNTGSMKVLGHPGRPADRLPDRVPRRHARHGAAAQRPRPRLHLRRPSSRARPKPASCLFCLPPPPGARFFDAQVANIEKLFETGKAPYPVERTLLTTGILDAVMASHHRGASGVETPELDVPYAAPADSGFLRGSIADL